MVKNLPAMLETQVCPWVEKIPWRREWNSSIHALRILWKEEPGGFPYSNWYCPMGTFFPLNGYLAKFYHDQHSVEDKINCIKVLLIQYPTSGKKTFLKILAANCLPSKYFEKIWKFMHAFFFSPFLPAFKTLGLNSTLRITSDFSESFKLSFGRNIWLLLFQV